MQWSLEDLITLSIYVAFLPFTRDATLLTQRFHFGRGVHNRHVSGWYRFITNLKASDVNAICVFDGKERNLAKAGEVYCLLALA
jgi:hypothetical protein